MYYVLVPKRCHLHGMCNSLARSPACLLVLAYSPSRLLRTHTLWLSAALTYSRSLTCSLARAYTHTNIN